jgi:hypothetical protein
MRFREHVSHLRRRSASIRQSIELQPRGSYRNQRRGELGLLGLASCRLGPKLLHKLLSALSKLLLRRGELGLLGLESCVCSVELDPHSLHRGLQALVMLLFLA